jgi:hypothetical protein
MIMKACCRGANDELRAAVQHAQANNPLKAIFAHLDILGASVNNKQQALAGLPPSAFPKNIPVFTGHYHKPHTVPGSAIMYIGSPFQRARSPISSCCAVSTLALLCAPQHCNFGW